MTKSSRLITFVLVVLCAVLVTLLLVPCEDERCLSRERRQEVVVVTPLRSEMDVMESSRLEHHEETSERDSGTISNAPAIPSASPTTYTSVTQMAHLHRDRQEDDARGRNYADHIECVQRTVASELNDDPYMIRRPSA